jgi:hypothetical protein
MSASMFRGEGGQSVFAYVPAISSVLLSALAVISILRAGTKRTWIRDAHAKLPMRGLLD